jgi:hypothetical protein
MWRDICAIKGRRWQECGGIVGPAVFAVMTTDNRCVNPIVVVNDGTILETVALVLIYLVLVNPRGTAFTNAFSRSMP